MCRILLVIRVVLFVFVNFVFFFGCAFQGLLISHEIPSFNSYCAKWVALYHTYCDIHSLTFEAEFGAKFAMSQYCLVSKVEHIA